MREIKFRAWDIDDEVMRDWKDVVMEKDERQDYFSLGYKENKAITNYDHEQVLMQYTGLKDKNGTEIYEGDITTNELYKIEGLAFVVYYENEKGMFKQRPFMFENNGKKLRNTDLSLQMNSVTNKEVIGNIYEDKHLLDDKQ